MIALAACAILVFVLVEDMRRFRVRNGAVVALTLCFPAACLAHGRPGVILPHLWLALAALAVLAGCFLAGLIGGGDAKLLAAALFWVGPEDLLAFALALLGATLAYAAGAWAGRLPARRVNNRLVMPFGPAVAVAAIATIGLATWGPT